VAALYLLAVRVLLSASARLAVDLIKKALGARQYVRQRFLVKVWHVPLAPDYFYRCDTAVVFIAGVGAAGSRKAAWRFAVQSFRSENLLAVCIDTCAGWPYFVGCSFHLNPMIRWVIAIFVLLAVFYPLLPFLDRLRVGRLPGDIRFRFKNIIFCLPFGSALAWSLVILAIAKITQLR
jgi:hypothetical protein